MAGRRKDREQGIYRRVTVRMWGDAKVMALSRPPPCGQVLWVHLLTGEQTDIIPGLCKIGEAAFAEQLGWSVEGFREAFREVSALGMAKADWKARVVWVPKAIEHNAPASPNVVTSWADAWDRIPECPLKLEAWRALRAFLEGMAEAFLQAFDKACPKPSVMPSGNQEQEQEQEQEQHAALPGTEHPEGATVDAPASSPRAARGEGSDAASAPPSWPRLAEFRVALAARMAVDADWLRLAAADRVAEVRDTLEREVSRVGVATAVETAFAVALREKRKTGRWPRYLALYVGPLSEAFGESASASAEPSPAEEWLASLTPARRAEAERRWGEMREAIKRAAWPDQVTRLLSEAVESLKAEIENDLFDEEAA